MTINCEGIKRSRDYIFNYLNDFSCDIFCVQETWHLDTNADIFSVIHSDFLYTAISGVDSKESLLLGRSKGGVGIFFKKSLSSKVKPIKSNNRRVCGLVINFKHVIDIKYDSSLIRNCNWSKAAAEHIDQYQLSLNERVLLIETNTITTNCRDWHCQCVEHRNYINVLCKTLINCGIDASHETIPMNRRVQWAQKKSLHYEI